jgi:hypothetical protein
VRRSPNLALTIFLYIAGILLVFMAVVLLIQAFAKVTIPREAITALVLLAIGAGILAGVRRGWSSSVIYWGGVAMKKLRLRPATTIFLTILSIAIVTWLLRGLGLLTFLPGGVLWTLIFMSVGAGVISLIQGTRRWAVWRTILSEWR